MASPSKLAHVVLQTNRIAEMRDWYCTVLGAHVVHDAGRLCFITYDDEHHRIALIDPGPLRAREQPTIEGGLSIGSAGDARSGDRVGLHHIAFTFPSLGDLLDTYVRLETHGLTPFWAINHGVTTSMYYRDPDGNQIELQVDNFQTAEEGYRWMSSAAFAKNPVGVEYDPDEMVARFRAGTPVEELVSLA